MAFTVVPLDKFLSTFLCHYNTKKGEKDPQIFTNELINISATLDLEKEKHLPTIESLCKCEMTLPYEAH